MRKRPYRKSKGVAIGISKHPSKKKITASRTGILVHLQFFADLVFTCLYILLGLSETVPILFSEDESKPNFAALIGGIKTIIIGQKQKIAIIPKINFPLRLQNAFLDLVSYCSWPQLKGFQSNKS
jgi:hypothetical protein